MVKDGKESACSVEDPSLIPGLGRSPGEGNGNSLQYSCLENPWTEEPGRLLSMGSLCFLLSYLRNNCLIYDHEDFHLHFILKVLEFWLLHLRDF